MHINVFILKLDQVTANRISFWHGEPNSSPCGPQCHWILKASKEYLNAYNTRFNQLNLLLLSMGWISMSNNHFILQSNQDTANLIRFWKGERTLRLCSSLYNLFVGMSTWMLIILDLTNYISYYYPWDELQCITTTSYTKLIKIQQITFVFGSSKNAKYDPTVINYESNVLKAFNNWLNYWDVIFRLITSTSMCNNQFIVKFDKITATSIIEIFLIFTKNVPR